MNEQQLKNRLWELDMSDEEYNKLAHFQELPMNYDTLYKYMKWGLDKLRKKK